MREFFAWRKAGQIGVCNLRPPFAAVFDPNCSGRLVGLAPDFAAAWSVTLPHLKLLSAGISPLRAMRRSCDAGCAMLLLFAEGGMLGADRLEGAGIAILSEFSASNWLVAAIDTPWPDLISLALGSFLESNAPGLDATGVMLLARTPVTTLPGYSATYDGRGCLRVLRQPRETWHSANGVRGAGARYGRGSASK